MFYTGQDCHILHSSDYSILLGLGIACNRLLGFYFIPQGVFPPSLGNNGELRGYCFQGPNLLEFWWLFKGQTQVVSL